MNWVEVAPRGQGAKGAGQSWGGEAARGRRPRGRRARPGRRGGRCAFGAVGAPAVRNHAPRAPAGIDRILAVAFGAFVEGTHLAGIGALPIFAEAQAAEVASLYTVTRFTGQGLGAHLVRYAVNRARELGLRYAFACTTSPRVGDLFERHGFFAVPQSDVPAEKWQDYDQQRRGLVLCFRHDLSPRHDLLASGG